MRANIARKLKKMSNSTYLIGEIGQNHNGSVDLAKLLIDLISRPIYDEVFGDILKGMEFIILPQNQHICIPNTVNNKVRNTFK